MDQDISGDGGRSSLRTKGGLRAFCAREMESQMLWLEMGSFTGGDPGRWRC